jgi:MoxR-like ATPase
MSAIINHVERSDVRSGIFNIEDRIVDQLYSDHVALVGLPGIGKSATAAAIAAKYSLPQEDHGERPAVILSIDTTGDARRSKIILVRIKDRKGNKKVLQFQF